MTDEQLAEMDSLTDLTHNQIADLLHVIWLDGFHQGCSDTAWRTLKRMHDAIGDIFLAGDDVTATKLRELYNKTAELNVQAKNGKQENDPQAEKSKVRIRSIFRLCHRIVLESER